MRHVADKTRLACIAPNDFGPLVPALGALIGEKKLQCVMGAIWLPHAQHLLVASSLTGNTPLRGVVGDGMVSVKSATADDPTHPLPHNVQTHVLTGLHHAHLAFSPAVADVLLAWLPGYAQAAGPVEVPTPASVTPTDRLAGLAQLGLDAVAHGHRAVAQVRLGRADQVLAAVKAVAPAATVPAKAAHAVHAGVVTAQHAVIDVGVAVATKLLDT